MLCNTGYHGNTGYHSNTGYHGNAGYQVTIVTLVSGYHSVQIIAVLIIALLLVPEHLVHSLAFSPREVISLPVTKHCL